MSVDIGAIPADRPVLIAGPTASGKSALAARIVRDGGGVVVNADALQVYGRWRILTARPGPEEEAAVPHRLYGHVAHDADYSVGHWLRDLRPLIEDGPRPVIVGGTGLYFAALTEGLAAIPPTPRHVRAEGDAILRDHGLPALIAGTDAPTLARTDRTNPARVQRAWEVLRATGRGLAEWQRDTPPPLLGLGEATALVLRPEKRWLDARIDHRFDAMIAAGALEEVRAAMAGWDPALPSARAIGAPDLVAYLRTEITLDEAAARAKAATRRYAKRQRTWFRNRMADWTPLDPAGFGSSGEAAWEPL